MSETKVSPIAPLQELTPEELLLRFKNGDEECFSHLARLYEKALWGMTASLSVPEEEKEDLRQEGLIALFKAVHLFDPKLSSFSTFARVCMRSAIFDGLRRYKRIQEKSEMENESLISHEKDPESLLMEQLRLQEMLKKMEDSLSPLERRVFALKLEGKSLAEIASAIGKSTKSVENTLFRARKKLSSLFSIR